MQRPEEENSMPRALILLPLMLVIQGAILYLLRLVWRLFRRWDRQDREDRF